MGVPGGQWPVGWDKPLPSMFLIPLGGMSRATLGAASMELQPLAVPQEVPVPSLGSQLGPCPPSLPQAMLLWATARPGWGWGGSQHPAVSPRSQACCHPRREVPSLSGLEQGLEVEEPFPGSGNWRALG